MEIHMSLDQGGTKTLAVVFDGQGRIIGKGTAYGACFYYDGLDAAIGAIRLAAQAALTESNARLAQLKIITAGITGINWPEEEVLMRSALTHEFPDVQIYLYNDCLLALRAGSDSVDCAVIAAGTGLNVAIRTKSGERLYNGYVDRLDQGGKGLGERILRAVFDVEIGILPPSALTERVLEYFGRSSVEQLLYDWPRNQLEQPLKDMTYLLFETAATGDAVAVEIVQSFGVRVARYVTAGMRQYGLVHCDMDVVLTGGIFSTQHPLLVDAVTCEVHSASPRARIVRSPYQPVIGGVKMTLEHIYGSIPMNVLQNCETTSGAFDLTASRR